MLGDTGFMEKFGKPLLSLGCGSGGFAASLTGSIGFIGVEVENFNESSLGKLGRV